MRSLYTSVRRSNTWPFSGSWDSRDHISTEPRETPFVFILIASKSISLRSLAGGDVGQVVGDEGVDVHFADDL